MKKSFRKNQGDQVSLSLFQWAPQDTGTGCESGWITELANTSPLDDPVYSARG